MTLIDKKSHPAVKAHIDMLQGVISRMAKKQCQLQELGDTSCNGYYHARTGEGNCAHDSSLYPTWSILSLGLLLPRARAQVQGPSTRVYCQTQQRG